MQQSGIFAIFVRVHFSIVTALSRVSAPISLQQQSHLAFISEFNVQLLYLPGPKMASQFFVSPTPPTGAIWNCCCCGGGRSSLLRDHAAEQNRCTETPPLLGGSSLKLAF
jgi:hypothetical protein